MPAELPTTTPELAALTAQAEQSSADKLSSLIDRTSPKAPAEETPDEPPG